MAKGRASRDFPTLKSARRFLQEVNANKDKPLNIEWKPIKPFDLEALKESYRLAREKRLQEESLVAM